VFGTIPCLVLDELQAGRTHQGRCPSNASPRARRWPMWPGPTTSMPRPSAYWQLPALSSKARAPSNEAWRLGFDLPSDRNSPYGIRSRQAHDAKIRREFLRWPGAV